MKKCFSLLFLSTILMLGTAHVALAVSAADADESLRYASPEEIRSLGLQWDGDEFIGWDWCRNKGSQCTCSNTGRRGTCDYGNAKRGLYCRC
jgi:hypothetical protein